MQSAPTTNVTMKKLACLLALLLSAQFSPAASRATMSFLTIPSSPTSNGYGGLLLPSGLDDPLAPLDNPAALGFIASQSPLSAAFYPARTQWGPYSFVADEDMRYSARALNLGVNPERLAKWLGRPTKLSLGVGYNEVYFDLGEILLRDSQNETIGSYHAYERMNGLSFGLGYESRIKAALGFSIKYVKSDLGPYDASGFSHDIGAIVQFPLLNFRRESARLESPYVLPFLTPSVSYAMTDIGGGIDYTDEPGQEDPLPRTEHITFALSSRVTLRAADKHDWQLATLDIGIQAEEELITQEADYRYEYPLSDINLINDLLFGESNDRIQKRRGFEIGLLELFYLRRGSFEHTGDHVRYETSGFGIRLSGVLKLAEHFGNAKWTDRFDVEYSESSFTQYGEYPAYDGLTYRQISLFIK